MRRLTPERRMDQQLKEKSVRRLMVASVLVVLALGGCTEEPPAGSFVEAGSFTEGRTNHTATLLPDDRVLVVGGRGGDRVPLTSTEVWDPVMAFGEEGSLGEGGSLGVAREAH